MPPVEPDLSRISELPLELVVTSHVLSLSLRGAFSPLTTKFFVIESEEANGSLEGMLFMSPEHIDIKSI